MKSNDNIPEDEFRLAALIAAASAKGLIGCRGYAFRNNHGPCVLESDQEFATACCAIGAASLAGLDYNDSMIDGNDAPQSMAMPEFKTQDQITNWNIGAAFNLAMDPDNDFWASFHSVMKHS